MSLLAGAKRREFLRFLAASPLAARAWAQQSSSAVSRAADALSVSDFEALTRSMLPPAHLGYLISGVDDDATLKLNREGFQHYQIRPRRLVDVSKIDTSVTAGPAPEITPPGLTIWPSDNTIPSIYSWYLGIQRELPAKFSLDLSYAGNPPST